MQTFSQASPSGLILALLVTFLVIAARAYVFAGIGIALRGARALARYRVSEQKVPRDRLVSEIRAGLITFLVDAALYIGAVALNWIVFDSSFSWMNAAVTFGSLFVLYELWFYGLHRALHSDLLYPIHRLHHLGPNPHPLTAFSFSVVERLLLGAGAIGLASMVSQRAPLSAIGYGVFGLVGVLTGVVGHLNVELYPRIFADSNIGRLFTSATFHTMHHELQRGHYGLSTTVLDRVFDTCRWDEYLERFRRLRS
jgi:Delta7-sterol 5-desaturase